MKVDEVMFGVLQRTTDRNDLADVFADVVDDQLKAWFDVVSKLRREETVLTDEDLLSLQSLVAALSVNDPGEDVSDLGSTVGFNPTAIRKPQPDVSRQRQEKSERSNSQSIPGPNRLDNLTEIIKSVLEKRRGQ